MAFLALDSRSEMPRVKYATALDLYIAMCFVFVLSAIVQFALVHRYTKHGHGDVEPTPHDYDDDDDDEDTEDDCTVRIFYTMYMDPGLWVILFHPIKWTVIIKMR